MHNIYAFEVFFVCVCVCEWLESLYVQLDKALVCNSVPAPAVYLTSVHELWVDAV